MSKKIHSFIFSVLALLAVSACAGHIIEEPVRPESLLDLSSERVSFSLSQSTSVEELTDWVNNDQPSRAEIYCTSTPEVCAEAKSVLQQFGIQFEEKAGRESGDEIVLLYDRIFTRDCDGESTGAIGCSVAANQVQMVVDPRQYLDPALLDLQDAEKASRVYEQYQHGGKKRKLPF